MNPAEEKSLHNIAKNIDYSLRINDAKYVIVASDGSGDGKSTFLKNCIPVLASLYKKKILIYDCQTERDDLLEKEFSSGPQKGQFIQKSPVVGLDYVHYEDLTFLNKLPENERPSAITNHFAVIATDYDVVFINMKTLKRAEKTILPVLPIDGAILIRSRNSSPTEKSLTDELRDREIPILGIIKNEGI